MSVLIHPSLHLDLAREHESALDARAEQHRLAHASRRARPRAQFAARVMAFVHSAVQFRRSRKAERRVEGDLAARSERYPRLPET
jgi:hypothetical protein